MYRSTRLISLILLTLGAMGCSGIGDNPATPLPQLNQALPVSDSAASSLNRSNTHLWAFYDVYLDFENGTIEAMPNRELMFAANVVVFLNNKPNSIQFQVNDTPVTDEYIFADVDVSITHPFPGNPQYDGYDVRGVFIGDGTETMEYNSHLKYADWEDEQVLVNADGYTRWFNPREFPSQGVLGYRRGIYASPDYTGSASLNPYKYYSDDLEAHEDPTRSMASGYINGIFSSGNTNGRNYYIRFPFPNPGVKFCYAVIANWDGEAPEDHPAYAPEAVACEITDSSTLQYTSPTNIAGDLILDVSLYSFNESALRPDRIYLESPNLGSLYEFTDEMIPVGGGLNYSTYHVEIEDFPAYASGTNEYFIITEYADYDYTNEFGVHNQADTDPLAAFFRREIRIIDPNAGWATTYNAYDGYDEEGDCAVDSEGNVYLLTINGDLVKFDVTGSQKWDISLNSYWPAGVDVDDDGNVYATYSGGIVARYSPNGEQIWESPGNSSNSRGIAVSGDNVYVAQRGAYFGSSYTTDGDFRWDYETSSNPQAHAIAVDGDRVYVSGRFSGSVDFGDGTDVQSEGGYDVCLVALDTDGNFLWKKAFGGSGWDESRGVAAANGFVYVMGSFNSPDFNRGDETRIGTKGWLDVFVTCFAHTGAYWWTKVIGGKHDDRSWAICANSDGDIMVTGRFQSADFDPGNGSQISTNGYYDVFVCTFDKNGNYLWHNTFGSTSWDIGSGVDMDDSGNVYVMGQYGGACDIAPGPPCDNNQYPVDGRGTFLIKYLSDGCW